MIFPLIYSHMLQNHSKVTNKIISPLKIKVVIYILLLWPPYKIYPCCIHRDRQWDWTDRGVHRSRTYRDGQKETVPTEWSISLWWFGWKYHNPSSKTARCVHLNSVSPQANWKMSEWFAICSVEALLKSNLFNPKLGWKIIQKYVSIFFYVIFDSRPCNKSWVPWPT